MTSEEAILHIRKVLDQFQEDHDEMCVVSQMRHEGELWWEFSERVREILEAAGK